MCTRFAAWVALFLLVCQADAGVTFPVQIETKIGDKTVKLKRTGSAIRKKGIFKVYAVAGYVEEGAKAASAQDLIDSDGAKQLHLQFLRDVSGLEMADAFSSILRANHPAPEFAAEVDALTAQFKKSSVKSGDHVYLIHVPKVGFVCKRPGSEDIVIRNVAFSKAIWENYLGKHNCGEEVKKGLISELTP